MFIILTHSTPWTITINNWAPMPAGQWEILSARLQQASYPIEVDLGLPEKVIFRAYDEMNFTTKEISREQFYTLKDLINSHNLSSTPNVLDALLDTAKQSEKIPTWQLYEGMSVLDHRGRSWDITERKETFNEGSREEWITLQMQDGAMSLAYRIDDIPKPSKNIFTII